LAGQDHQPAGPGKEAAMRRRLKWYPALAALALVAGLSPARPCRALLSADQVLTDIGLSPADKQRVFNGEFVTRDGPVTSERDLSGVLAFLVKTSPDQLSKQVSAGGLIRVDPQVKSYGLFSAEGSLADLAGLEIMQETAQALVNAGPGEEFNLSTSEIAAFHALKGSPDLRAAAQAQLRRMLLARYQAYQASGLEGIAPYDRGNGRFSDPAGDLRTVSLSARTLQQHLPALHAVLTDYPRKTMPEPDQHLAWQASDIDGKPTFALTQVLTAADGDARAVVQRQFYVSSVYNAEQAMAGFLPIAEGTLVVYVNHTFTDQVAGLGGSVKRNVGRRIMLQRLTEMFEAERSRVTR
jgi:hypothetical protein